MPSLAYRDRDYNFGQQLLALRTQANLTQSGLAQILGVSRQAVVGWESGASYPSPHHLKHLVELYIRRKAFHSGQEADEIRALWQAARARVPLDEIWLERLIATSGKAAGSPVSLSHAQETDVAARPAAKIVDWQDAPEVSNFYGREAELELAADWALEQHCRVVSIVGMGGIGKSALAVSLMHRVAEQFDAVLWRSLRDAPPFESLLDGLLSALTGEPTAVTPEPLERRMNVLFEQLRARRALLVLDNLESVMEPAEGSGRFLPGYDGYERLLRRAAETRHRSCIVLTSREKPNVLAPLEGSHTPVRSLPLGQLDALACQALLTEQEIVGSAEGRERLIGRYGGNPLALKIVAPTIADLFGGDLDTFLEQGELIFGGVRALLQEQFARLSAPEQSIMLWLAVLREPVMVPQLERCLVRPVPRAALLEALDSLRSRSLIERGGTKAGFTLQSVVFEYTTTRMVEMAVAEIERGSLFVLIDHALELAMVPEYVREAQRRQLVMPVLARLRATYPDALALERRLLELLEPFRGLSSEAQGYAPANLVMLLRALRGNLSGLDLHQLSLRGADLGVELRGASLAGATLRDLRFTEAYDTVWSMAFSKNGTFWAGGDRQGQVHVWAYAQRRLHMIWKAHSGIVSAVAFSPDEQFLATGSWDGVIKLWNPADGTLLWCSPMVSAIMRLVWSPDGHALASAGTDGVVRIWDPATGAMQQALTDHSGPVFQVDWSADGTLLASAGNDALIRLWRVTRTDPVRLKPAPLARLSGHDNIILGLAFAPDGQMLASAGLDRTVRLWDVAKRAEMESIPIAARPGALVWSSDGRYLAAGELDRAFWVWDLEQHKPRTRFYGPMAPVRTLAFNPDSSTLDTADVSGSVKVWDMTTGQLILNAQGFACALHDVAWSPDGSLVATSGNDAVLVVWDVAKRVPRYQRRGHTMMVWGLAWSPDGQQIASCSEDSTIRLWDAHDGTSLAILRDARMANTLLFGVAWSPDGERLAVASYQGGVLVYDRAIRTFQLLADPAAAARIRSVQWSPDGRYLASGSESGVIRIWDMRDAALCATLEGHRGMVAALAWRADGARLASGSWGRGRDQLLLWDTKTWNRVATLPDPGETVNGVAWSADGSTLVSAGDDGRLRWWNAETGECLLTRRGHEGTVEALRASPDGHSLASCGDDGAIQLWELEGGEPVAVLRRDRPYERLDITGIKGLTAGQTATLKMLGAIEHNDE